MGVTDLLHEPLIINQLPVNFSNGIAVSTFTGKCACCGRRFGAEEIRGKVDTSFANVAVIAAAAHCQVCNVVTDLSLRARPDRSVQKKEKGEWVTTSASSTTSPGRRYRPDLAAVLIGVLIGWLILAALTHRIEVFGTRVVGYNRELYQIAERIGKKFRLISLDDPRKEIVVPVSATKKAV